MLAVSFSNGWIRCVKSKKENNAFKITDLKSQKIPDEINNYSSSQEIDLTAFSDEVIEEIVTTDQQDLQDLQEFSFDAGGF